MAKIKLDLDSTEPLTFVRLIKIPTPSGAALDIKWTLKHRLRDEMAELMTSYRERAAQSKTEAKAEGVEEVPLTKEQAANDARMAAESDADAIMDVAIGWDLDGFAFGKENLTKFCMRYMAAAGVILKDYSVSMYEGRLGN